MARAPLPPLWTCPKCGAKFVSANMWHSCGRFALGALFAKSEPHVFKLFEKFRAIVWACGRSTMIPQKTRVVFIVRMRFAGATVRKSHLRVGLILERRLPPDPRLVETLAAAPRCYAHYFKIDRADQLDASFAALVREAYDSGTQRIFNASAAPHVENRWPDPGFATTCHRRTPSQVPVRTAGSDTTLTPL